MILQVFYPLLLYYGSRDLGGMAMQKDAGAITGFSPDFDARSLLNIPDDPCGLIQFPRPAQERIQLLVWDTKQ